jgi:hypothetical protein
MRNFKAKKQYHWTRFTSDQMHPDLFKAIFWEFTEKMARKCYYNGIRRFTIRNTHWLGYDISSIEPIYANNWYELLVKLRARVRDCINIDIFNYDAIMDSIDDYVETEMEQPSPDLGLSLENIVDYFIDELEDGSSRYGLHILHL